MDWTNLLQTLNEFGEALRDNYREQLDSEDVNASNTLSNTARYQVDVNGERYEVSLDLKKYYYWLEYGRKPGKLPPLQPFLDWVSMKKSLPRVDNPRRFAEGIRWNLTSIENGGGGKRLEGKHLLEKATEKTLNDFDTRISEAISKDITAWLNS